MDSPPRILASLAACALIAGCGSSPAAPGHDRSAAELRAAPTTVAVEGITIRLTPGLYRDFQPVSPPDGKPMIGVLIVRTTDGSAFPPSARAERAWVLFGQEIWAADIQEEHEQPPGSSFREWVIRDGPKWGPGVLVDVVIELVRNNLLPALLLQAPNQLVQRAD